MFFSHLPLHLLHFLQYRNKEKTYNIIFENVLSSNHRNYKRCIKA